MPKSQAITLSQAIEGYPIAAHARGLAANTIREYTYYYSRLTQFFASHTAGPDPLFEAIGVVHIQEFLNSLTKSSQKTKVNIHIALSSMWKWGADSNLVPRNIIRDIKMNKAEQRAIHPFTKEDVALSDRQCRTFEALHPARQGRMHARLKSAITQQGLSLARYRAARREVATLQVKNFEMKNTRVKVFGKGSKERIVPFSYQTGQVIWRHLTTRDTLRPDDYVFVSSHDRQLGHDVNQ